MTTAADDAAVEDAFEAILAGRAAPEGAAGLAAFTEAVRATATPPGRPSAALADLLVSGQLVDQSSPSTRTARSAGNPPSRDSRNRIRRRFAMIFPALLAKILAGGALAQAATGATVVVVAVTGAGAAGVLPGPVQDRFAAVVEVVTPFEAPTSEDESATDEETPAEELPVGETPDGEVPVVDEDPSGVPAEPTTEAPTADEVVDEWMGQEIEGSFGAWVSAARHDPALLAAIEETGHNFGYYVSRRAHERGLTDDDLEAEGVELGEDEVEDDGTEVAESPDDDQVQSSAPTRGQRSGHGGGGNQGGGSGGGSGSGNGGGGNQGHGGGGNGGGGNGGGGGNDGGRG